MDSYSRAAVSALWEAVVISTVDVGASLGVSLIFGFVFSDVLGTVLLAEGACLLLVGGALGFAGQPGVRRIAHFMGILGFVKPGKKDEVRDERTEVRQIDVRAAFYMMTGVGLFIESLLLAVLVQSIP